MSVKSGKGYICCIERIESERHANGLQDVCLLSIEASDRAGGGRYKQEINLRPILGWSKQLEDRRVTTGAY